MWLKRTLGIDEDIIGLVFELFDTANWQYYLNSIRKILEWIYLAMTGEDKNL